MIFLSKEKYNEKPIKISAKAMIAIKQTNVNLKFETLECDLAKELLSFIF